MTSLTLSLLLVVLFFAGSWFFSGFESGIVSINRHRLLYRVRHGDANAKALSAVLSDTHRLLATVLVGNNICNVSLSTLASGIALTLANTYSLESEWLQVAATTLVALLLLAIGEYLPKLWFTARPIERCSALLTLFLILRNFLYPLASLCVLLTRLVTGKKDRRRSPFVSRENINFLTQDSQAHGQISAFERLMIKQVLQLQTWRASRIMTPLKRVSRVYASDNAATILRTFRQCQHRILPVFSDDDRECLGVLHRFDLLRHRDPSESPFALRRAPVFVHKDTPADELLPYMRVRATKILIVRGDHGPIGIITQEDVLSLVMDDNLLKSSTTRRPSHHTL